MAFDGICVAAITKELRENLIDGRIVKIAQPEKDELLLTIKNNGQQYRLVMNADASLPLLYLTKDNKKSPMTAPNFCMLLRKHIQNGRITDILQPGLERVVQFHIEHLDEMGDLCKKTLAIELMGKYSNIIFYDDKDMILDSIKHISSLVSSVREVLPGRTYFIPETMDKKDAFALIGNTPVKEENIEFSHFSTLMLEKAMPVYKRIYTLFTGISPIMAQEICYRAKVDADFPVNVMDEKSLLSIYETMQSIMTEVSKGHFRGTIYYKNKKNAENENLRSTVKEPMEYGVIPFDIYDEYESRQTESISTMLFEFYEQKNIQTRIRQKSSDLRRIVATALERNVKKYDLQLRQLKDTEKRDKYKVYGELLHTYGYQASDGDKSITVENYYTNEPITIPLDPAKTALENAAKYFDKYGKMKRTFEALTQLVKETKEEIDHLESIVNALDIAQQEEDLVQIKEELIQSGYIRFKGGKKKQKIMSKPMHFRTSDGFDIYVGKNNFQNEEITFQMAQGNDWWFHAKGMPGSHVVVKNGGKEMSDEAFEEAGRLAAHFSKAKGMDKIEVDYIEKKHVKKPGGAKPGFVVYYTNYSLLIDSDISQIERVE